MRSAVIVAFVLVACGRAEPRFEGRSSSNPRVEVETIRTLVADGHRIGERLAAAKRKVVVSSGDSEIIVLERLDGEWQETLRLEPPTALDGTPYRFRESLATDGDTIVASARASASVVVVFEADGAIHVIEPTDDDERFGDAVAIDGDLLVVGQAKAESGRVVVYRREVEGWRRAHELTDDTAAFGFAVAVTSDSILIGAPAVPGGTVRIHDRNTLEEQARLSAPTGPAVFGLALTASPDGNALAVRASKPGLGVPERDYGLQIFERHDGTWQHQGSIEPRDGGTREGFGTTATWTNGVLWVGAPSRTVNGLTAAGAVDAFVLGNDGWTRSQTIHLEIAEAFGAFGTGLASTNDTLFIGSPSRDLSGAGVLYAAPLSR